MFLILFIINKSELDITLLVDVIMSISLDRKCEIFSPQVLQIDSENLIVGSLQTRKIRIL